VIPGKSAPPPDLKAIFRQWDDEAWPLTSSKINAINLDEAFDMLDRQRFRIKELQDDCLPLGVDSDKLEVQSLLLSVLMTVLFE
jgi:hypothetical protein